MRYRKPRKREVLSSEAESFIRHAKLEKSRDREDDTELIRKLISSNLEGHDSSAGGAGRSPQADDTRHVLDSESEKRIQLEFRGVVGRVDAEKNRERIAAYHERAHFLRFLLREYGKLKEFAKRTKVITCTLIPPKVRISAGIRTYFSGYLKESAARLRAPLEHVLNEGWRTLRKLEYNLVAEFSELCRIIRGINFKRLPVGDSRLDSLKKLETAFLTCHYQPDYPQLIKKAVGIVLDRERKFEDDLSELKAAVDIILLENNTQPCLYNFVAGLNMVRSRRFVPFSSLINQGAGGVVNTAHFNCKRRVQKRINRHMDSVLTRLTSLQKEKTEVERLKLFLDVDETGEGNFERLFGFINSANAIQGIRAENELDDMARFTLLLFSTFVREIAPFLSGKVSVGPSVRIFSEDYFRFEVERLRYSLAGLEEMQSSVPAFSRVRYIGLRGSSAAGEPRENELLRLITALASFVLSVGKKLMQIKLFESGADSGAEAPLDPKDVAKKGFAIPYRDLVLESTGVLGGMSVVEAIGHVASVCYQVGLFYRDSSLTRLLERRKSIDLEIASTKNTLNRLADPLQFQKIQQFFEPG